MNVQSEATCGYTLSTVVWVEQVAGAAAFLGLAPTIEGKVLGSVAILATAFLHVLADKRFSRYIKTRAMPRIQSAESSEIESYHNPDPIPSKELLELRHKQNSNVVTDWDPAIEGKRLIELESEFSRTVVEQNATYKSIYKPYKSNRKR